MDSDAGDLQKLVGIANGDVPLSEPCAMLEERINDPAEEQRRDFWTGFFNRRSCGEELDKVVVTLDGEGNVTPVDVDGETAVSITELAHKHFDPKALEAVLQGFEGKSGPEIEALREMVQAGIKEREADIKAVEERAGKIRRDGIVGASSLTFD